MCTLHPASTSVATATRLCGTSSTRNASRAFRGSLPRHNSSVFDVFIGMCDGVFKLKFGFCSCAIFAVAAALSTDTDAAESRYAVVRLGSGGPAQPGGGMSSLTTLNALFSMQSPPAGSTSHPPAAFLLALCSTKNALRPAFAGSSKQSLGTCLAACLPQVLHCCPVTKR